MYPGRGLDRPRDRSRLNARIGRPISDRWRDEGMKHLLLTVDVEDGGTSSRYTYLLEGDRRQTPERMIERAAAEILEATVEPDEDFQRFRGDNGLQMTVEARELVNRDRADELKRQHVTLIVNENVTEKACRVGYSGPYHE